VLEHSARLCDVWSSQGAAPIRAAQFKSRRQDLTGREHDRPAELRVDDLQTLIALLQLGCKGRNPARLYGF